MDDIGTLTITGEWPMEVDGLFLGYGPRRSIRYKITTVGFLRGRKLFRTLDHQVLLAKWSSAGVRNLTHKIKSKAFNQ